MTTDSLKRVLWRVKEEHGQIKMLSLKMLTDAIMHERGTDPRTIQKHIDALLKLGWIKKRQAMPFEKYIYSSTEEGDAV